MRPNAAPAGWEEEATAREAGFEWFRFVYYPGSRRLKIFLLSWRGRGAITWRRVALVEGEALEALRRLITEGKPCSR